MGLGNIIIIFFLSTKFPSGVLEKGTLKAGKNWSDADALSWSELLIVAQEDE